MGWCVILFTASGGGGGGGEEATDLSGEPEPYNRSSSLSPLLG